MFLKNGNISFKMKISKVTDYAALMIVFPSINETCADPQRGKGGPPPQKKTKTKKKNYNWPKFSLRILVRTPLEKKNVNFFSGPHPPLPKISGSAHEMYGADTFQSSVTLSAQEFEK